MTPTTQLLDLLTDLELVLKTIRNDPKYIVPENHFTYLDAALYDCLIAIKITKNQITNFEEKQRKTKEDFIKEKGYTIPLDDKQEKEISEIFS